MVRRAKSKAPPLTNRGPFGFAQGRWGTPKNLRAIRDSQLYEQLSERASSLLGARTWHVRGARRGKPRRQAAGASSRTPGACSKHASPLSKIPRAEKPILVASRFPPAEAGASTQFKTFAVADCATCSRQNQVNVQQRCLNLEGAFVPGYIPEAAEFSAVFGEDSYALEAEALVEGGAGGIG